MGIDAKTLSDAKKAYAVIMSGTATESELIHADNFIDRLAERCGVPRIDLAEAVEAEAEAEAEVEVEVETETETETETERITQSELAFGGKTLRELIGRPCWDIAEKLGLGYFGDSSLIHGGTFFRRETWRKWGYAEAVRVLSDDGCVFITSGEIHRTDVEDALRSCGWRYAGDDADLYGCEPGDIVADHGWEVVASGESVTDCEISACVGWAGVEPDTDFGGTDDYCCPIVETENGEFFQYRELNSRTQNISLDCLEGFIVRRFLIRMLPTD